MKTHLSKANLLSLIAKVLKKHAVLKFTFITDREHVSVCMKVFFTKRFGSMKFDKCDIFTF